MLRLLVSPHALLLLFLLVCAAYFSVPLADSDFWWHIAAGRDILQQGAVPSVDPFGVYPATDAVRSETVLKGQWLGQVVLYGLFEAAGINAVVAFRVAVLLACLALIYARARVLITTHPLLLWTVLGLAAVNVTGFGGERPQLLSFLFAALFFVVVDLAQQRRNWRWLLPLPLITLLWANSHGGVILGVVLLGLWSVLAWFDKSMSRRERTRWLVMSGVVFFASLLTPNGIQTYLYLFQLEGSVLQQRTSEYISTLKLYELGLFWPQVWAAAYLLFAVVGLGGLLKLQRWREAALLAFLLAISVSSYRYLVFLIVIASPYILLGLAGLLPTAVGRQFTQKITQLVVATVLLGLLLNGAVRGSFFQGGFYRAAYPVAISDFVASQYPRHNAQQSHGLRTFNTLEWGGYLLWRLGGQVQPYIDGRMLDMSRFPPYTHMLWATPQGIRFFERSHFQLVILPYHGRFDPQRYKLIDYLSTQRDWQLAYRDALGVVFVRRSGQNFFPAPSGTQR